MATVASTTALASALASLAARAQHAWLDPELGLVAGSFPAAEAKFDFGTETMVPLSSVTAEKTVVSLLGTAPRLGQVWEIETFDAVYRVGSATQMLIHGLELIETIRPGTLEKLSERKKRSKRPVARHRADLYDTHHPDSHSASLKCGYFVATNNKAGEARGYLRQAAELAGLEWGRGFTVRRA